MAKTDYYLCDVCETKTICDPENQVAEGSWAILVVCRSCLNKGWGVVLEPPVDKKTQIHDGADSWEAAPFGRRRRRG